VPYLLPSQLILYSINSEDAFNSEAVCLIKNIVTLARRSEHLGWDYQKAKFV
jgi:hypothetical protein